MQSRREVQTFRGHTDSVNCVVFTGDGNRLVSGSDDRTVRFWDRKSGQEFLSFLHNFSVRKVSFSGDGLFLAAASRLGAIRLWDAPLDVGKTKE